MKITELLYIGDVVEMRKPHPCGGTLWEIVRVGADIGLVCQTCRRRILLPRRQFAARAKRFVRRSPNAQPPTGQSVDAGTPPTPSKPT